MKDPEFKKLFDESVKREEDLLLTKGKEYRCGDDDVLANFKRLAQKMDIPIEKVWAIYFTKHIDSIINFVKSGKTFSDEGIQGRIDDARNYLMLGRAIFMEKHQIELPSHPSKNPYFPIGALPPGSTVNLPWKITKTDYPTQPLKDFLDAEIKDLENIETQKFLKGFKKDG